MTDPNLRCQVPNAMAAALPPIPLGTCIISDIDTDTDDMVDVMLSTAAELVPRSKHPRVEYRVGARGPEWRLR